MKEKRIQNWYAFAGLCLLIAVLIIGASYKAGWILNVDTPIDTTIDKNKEDFYKIILTLDKNNISEEQFKDLSDQWVHYIISETWNLSSSYLEITNVEIKIGNETLHAYE